VGSPNVLGPVFERGRWRTNGFTIKVLSVARAYPIRSEDTEAKAFLPCLSQWYLPHGTFEVDFFNEVAAAPNCKD
jgi:hypothetical protein